jgi:rubredoxin
MAQFSCNGCGFEGHDSEFKEDGDDAGGDNPDYEPDLECPECGSSSVSED